ncbi:hypothetical protein ABLE68_19565 [Nocardioides sp. CN2-186]|uniref:hypothetical protein n=1 Tax=Nocardioides tweenelious TaxID=3156607 RepID=UPI0032B3A667
MREIVHLIATALVVLVAAVCVLVQVGSVDRAISDLKHDDGTSIRQVSSDTAPGR